MTTDAKPRPWWHWALIALAVVATGGLALFLLRRPGAHEEDAARAQGRREAFEVAAEAHRAGADEAVKQAGQSRIMAGELAAAAHEAAKASERAVEVVDERAKKIDEASDLDAALEEYKRGR